MVSDRVPCDFGAGLEAKLFHEFVLVKGYGPWRDVEHIADFRHYLSLSQQLQNFSLSFGQLFSSLDQRLIPYPMRSKLGRFN